ncbi:MAG: DUF3052 domain-containing protein [Gemmatimonadales bacterium]
MKRLRVGLIHPSSSQARARIAALRAAGCRVSFEPVSPEFLNAPRGFPDLLRDLPEGVKLQRTASAKNDLTIWFVRNRRVLERGIHRRASNVGTGGLWIAWPKKGSALASDLTQRSVRDIGLAHGLVDYRICAIDDTWSGLKFARRRRG